MNLRCVRCGEWACREHCVYCTAFVDPEQPEAAAHAPFCPCTLNVFPDPPEDAVCWDCKVMLDTYAWFRDDRGNLLMMCTGCATARKLAA